MERLNYMCPFTKMSFTTNDIGSDYKSNEFLEIYKRYNEIKIKNLSCNILFDTKKLEVKY